MEVLLSRDEENRTEHTRCTKSGVNTLCSDNDADVSDDPLDEQLPRMLLLILSTETHTKVKLPPCSHRTVIK